MLARFSLYGFLKNQRYFEAFLVLILLEKGFSFFLIGLLIGFRELVVNLLEIPSGAAADVWGKRSSMLLSYGAYIASFLVFGFAEDAPWIFGAMLLYAVGDSFRSGTHKALIFAWLQREGREAEKTRIYGFTRSWSKFGSALSVLVAAGIVYAGGRFSTLFFASVVPAVLGAINLLGYPRELDPPRAADAPRRSVGAIGRHMLETLRTSLRSRPLRRLMAESLGFEGAFHATKDYLQPALMALAVGAAGAGVAAATGTEESAAEAARTALFVAPVYFVLFLGAAAASRRAHVLPERLGGEERAAGVLWGVAALVFTALWAGAVLDLQVLLIVAFVVLHLLQNLWRPVLISRFHDHAGGASMATVLSIESQAKRIGTMVLAPVCGLAVDAATVAGGPVQLWPIGVLGLLVAIVFFTTRPRASGA